jgi:glycosyltransferase involved in cell wall biosynthesis
VKIGIVSQWYPPEPAFIPGELAGALAERGHEVRVLTTFPSYPVGKIYPGYRQRWNHRTAAAGLTVRRVPAYASHDDSALRRVASYASFALTSAAAALRYLRDVNVVYVYHPPPTAYAAAGLLRLLRHIPTVLHVQDMWPESVTASAMTPGGRAGSTFDRVLRAAMTRLYRAAAGIVTISPGMAELVIERGADPGAVRTVLNWTDESLFRRVPVTDAARTAIGHRDRCTVMFAGNLGPFQGVHTAVRAAAQARAHVDLVFVGSGTQETAARQLAETSHATNIRFLGRFPASDMADLYAAADYQLVTLRDLPALSGTVPSKIQAALASGSPVIVSANGDAAALIDSAGAGLTCPAEDWRALADRFTRAAALPATERLATAARAHRFYTERMSLRAGADQIEDVLIKVAGGSTS